MGGFGRRHGLWRRHLLNALYIACLTQFYSVWFPGLGLLKAPKGSGCEVAADPLHDPLDGVAIALV